MDDFLNLIYQWYQKNRRDLPWRETSDPYKIWVSEIILQQTRVNQGIGYYTAFIEKFGDIKTLADASEDDVLKSWQGLGYYSRARNLHFAAKSLLNQYGGKFPDEYDNILKLKGVGSYTAAAVASIAFNLPYAAVDGNVIRVISRYFGLTMPVNSPEGKKRVGEIAQTLLLKSNPGMHNQALMEFGALQCVPKSPECLNCPVNSSCAAFENNLTGKIPFTERKLKTKKRYFCYLLFETSDSVFIEKRAGGDIWEGLYQPPLLEFDNEFSDDEVMGRLNNIFGARHVIVKSETGYVKHVLSHQVIMAKMVEFEVPEGTEINNYLKVNKKDIFKFAFPRLVEKLLKNKITA